MKSWSRRSAAAFATISLLAASGLRAQPKPAIVLPDPRDAATWQKWTAELGWQVIAPEIDSKTDADTRAIALADAVRTAIKNSTADAAHIYLAGRSDNAAVKITTPGDWPFVCVAKAEDVKVGEWCFALGHAGGHCAGRTPPIWTRGSVTRFSYRVKAGLLQIRLGLSHRLDVFVRPHQHPRRVVPIGGQGRRHLGVLKARIGKSDLVQMVRFGADAQIWRRWKDFGRVIASKPR